MIVFTIICCINVCLYKPLAELPIIQYFHFSFLAMQGKHCLLDVTPFAVEQLNLMQYYPIVIFLNADSRSQVKDIRGQYMSPEQNKGSKKLYKTSLTLKKAFAHLFTGMNTTLGPVSQSLFFDDKYKNQ